MAGRKKVDRHDYAKAYRLEGGPVRLALASALAFALAGIAVAAVLARQQTPVFRPGPVSAAHASRIGDANCQACHTPFEGPAEIACATAGCHGDSSVHQPTQASTPPCGDCHFEHRGFERLTRVADAQCVACHGDLMVRPGAEPSVARAVHTFGGDHPDFVVPADDSTLRFGHARHLEPLRTPEGTVTLTCTDCHVPASGEDGRSGRMEPVSFEAHCQSCHLLTYDPGLPDDQAPHGTPREVRSYLLAAFADASGWRDLSFEERRRRIALDPERDRSTRLTTGERRAANQAEGYLFQAACAQCHVLEPGSVVPEVAPVSASRDWLAAGDFPHELHGTSQGLACTDCHDAEASRETADVLLPGIDTCRSCHGETGETTAGRKVPSACADCHDYHLPGHGATVAALQPGNGWARFAPGNR